MPRPIITLTTDFGEGSAYVAQMKGVILSLNPEVTIVDLTHCIPPQDVRRGAITLDEVARRFPPGTVHVAVVDPGVGTNRRIVLVESAVQAFVAPDNGLLSLVAKRSVRRQIISITNRSYWIEPVSATFHGRDIMAPVAAHLTLGVEPSALGDAIDDLTALKWSEVLVKEKTVLGSVVAVDSFGNLISDIRQSDLAAANFDPIEKPTIQCGESSVEGIVQTYGEAPAGSLVALMGSGGFLELAIVNGNAANKLGIVVGAGVIVKS